MMIGSSLCSGLLLAVFIAAMASCQTAVVQTTNYRLRHTEEALKANNTLSNTNPVYVNKYRKIETYIPNDSTPAKIIQLSFNIFTGPGTLQGSPEDERTLRQILDWVNGWYSNVAQPSDPLPGVAFLPDTKIRFELGDRIYFYKNPKLAGSCNVFEMEKVVKAEDSTRMSFLNVYFTFGNCTQHAITPWPGFDYYPTTKGMNGNQYVLMPITADPGYASAQTLAHELGHTLDLMHLYEGSCCHETCDNTSPEYLDDVFGPGGNKKCWQDGGWHCNPADTSNTCTNNMMSGVAVTGYYFSPKQIGKMHRALSIKTIKRYVKDTIHSPVPLVITGDETWDFEMRLYSDIIIKKGASLKLTAKLYMPSSTRIIVERGARLEVEEGCINSIDPSQKIQIVKR